MMNMMEDRRRSDRIWLTVPIKVARIDSNGEHSEYSGRAIGINRFGGKIQVPVALNPESLIRIERVKDNFKAEFRVVKSFISNAHELCECAVECLNRDINFWGIEFPSIEDKAMDAKVLLECGVCHTIALMPLSFSETDMFQQDGNRKAHCNICSAATLWWCPTIGLPAHRAPERRPSSVEMDARWLAPADEHPERGDSRAYLQLPLWIHANYGESDEVRTENISNLGFSFSSERRYLRGEIVRAAFPAASPAHRTKMPARIVREQVSRGSARRIYGATFAPPTRFKPQGA